MDNHNSTYWQSLLKKRIQGTITQKEQHALERRALDDPFLMEAIEGYLIHGDHESTINEIKTSIHPKKRKRKIPLMLYPIAAGLALLVAVTFYMRTQISTQDFIQQTSVVLDQEPEQEKYAYNQNENKRTLIQNEEPIEKITLPSRKNKSDKIVSPTPPIEDRRNENIVETVSTTPPPTIIHTTPPQPKVKSNEILAEEEPTIIKENKERKEIAYEAAPMLNKAAELSDDEVKMLEEAFEEQDVYSESTIEAEINTRNITGIITDNYNYPLIGANVIVDQSERGVVTDIDGRYRLALLEGDSFLNVSYTGYAMEKIDIPQDDTTLNIILEEGMMLDEVVVTESGQDGRVLSYILSIDGKSYAYPRKGMIQFKNDILYSNSQRRAKQQIEIGLVRMQFKISTSGFVQDIQIVFSSCDSCEEIARQLLKESGIWITSPPNTEVNLEYEFEFH